MTKSSTSVRIGVISDTHGYLDPQVLAEFAGVQHIIHAGDIMDAATLEALETIAPVTAVAGNMDDGKLGKVAARGRRQGRRHALRRRSQAQAPLQAACARQDREGSASTNHRTSSSAGTTTCPPWSGSTACCT